MEQIKFKDDSIFNPSPTKLTIFTKLWQRHIIIIFKESRVHKIVLSQSCRKILPSCKRVVCNCMIPQYLSYKMSVILATLNFWNWKSTYESSNCSANIISKEIFLLKCNVTNFTYRCELEVVQTVVVKDEPPPLPILYSSTCNVLVNI